MLFTVTLIYVFLLSMAPVVELRGGIPIGVSLGLSPWLSFLVAVAGNLVVIPPLLWFWSWLLADLERWPRIGPLVRRFEARVRLRGEEAVQRYGAIGLFLFVALPLPGTGAWSGTLLAAALGVKKRYALPAIALGVVVAGLLVTLASAGAMRGLEFLVR